MKYRKLFSSVLSMALAASAGASTILPAVSVVISAEASEELPAYGTNLALHKTATASSEEAASVAASNATDGDVTSKNSRWGSDIITDFDNANQWIYVDLGETKEVGAVRLFWEQRKPTAYSIQTAVENPSDEASWTTQKEFNDRPKSKTDLIELDAPVQARYVRLFIKSSTNEDPDGGTAWAAVSIYEMEVFGAKDLNYQDPSENVAKGKTASADGVETDDYVASKAFDGDESTRWASPVSSDPHWLMVDLGKDMDVQTVRILWETRKATSYRIQTAADGAPDTWTDQKTLGQPSDRKVTVKLDQKVKARYVRIYIDTFTALNPDDNVNWNNISINEVEVYGGEPRAFASLDDIAAAIVVNTPAAGDTKLSVELPDAGEDYEVKYNGTDLEQIVDADLNIHQPLVDKTVKVSFKVTNKVNNSYKFKEVSVTVPGRFHAEEGDNAAPAILPELQEWKGSTGSLAVNETTAVVYSDDIFADAAAALAEDYKEMTGKTMQVSKGAAGAQAGAVVFARTDDAALGKEGYTMKIDDGVEIAANDPAGAFYATRTLLQALMVSEDGTVPKGETRDYPTMAVRSFMLDVGRKTFTLDYIKQMAKAMAWYKYNDFQIHLNDNYIQVNQYWHVTNEEGVEEDRRLLDVYSAFRMESNIKKGGKDGAYKEDLTAKDLSYTKEEFSQLIDDCKKIGITIVPEFDMPAHSLALTKVRPDLRSPDSDLPHQSINDNRSSADHLDLKGQFDAVMEFVTEIWDEYTKGENRVFDTPIIHIGADEYEAGSAAYRKFVNSMFDYAEENGYKPRVWGSLSQLSQGEAVSGYKENADGTISRRQIDIWNTGWANPDKMYDLGFELINIVDGAFYIVPNAGYYYDYLGDNTYTSNLNQMGGVTIPMGDEQMVGASFAVWNDMCFDSDNGMSEYDIYRRIINSLGLFGANLWGKGSANTAEAKARAAVLNDIPGTNFNYDVETNEGIIASIDMEETTDQAGPGNNLGAGAQTVSVDGRKVLKLDENSTASIDGLETVGLGNSLRVKVKRMSSSNDQQILFESPYGTINAVNQDTGKVGLYREGRTYDFDYSLPAGEWAELEFRNEFEKIHLYVNGQLVDTLGTNQRNQLKATMMFPVEKIGSTEHPFIGYIDDLHIGETKNFASTKELDTKLAMLNAVGGDANVVREGYKLSGQYDPAQADIDAMIDQVDALLEKAVYAEADYSEVDAYLALVPEDLSLYTEESAAAVNAAKDAIIRSLPSGMQSNVDFMASNLHEALAGLKGKSSDDALIADQSKMKATASSYQSSTEPGNPEFAIDGDPNTMWHSDWSNTTMPHWLNIEFDAPTSIDQVIYRPRNGGGNGTATAYQIQVSDDGTTYNTVKTGTLANSGATKYIDLDAPVTTKNVRFVITAAGNNNGSCSELNVRLAGLPGDVDGLDEIIASVGKLETNQFTPESWDALQAAVTAAQAVKNNPDSSYQDVEAAKNSVREAITDLEVDLSEDPAALDYSVLEIVINDMTAEKLADIENSDNVKTVLDEAKALVGHAKNQTRIDNMTSGLHNIWLGARNTVSKEKLDKLK